MLANLYDLESKDIVSWLFLIFVFAPFYWVVKNNCQLPKYNILIDLLIKCDKSTFMRISHIRYKYTTCMSVFLFTLYFWKNVECRLYPLRPTFLSFFFCFLFTLSMNRTWDHLSTKKMRLEKNVLAASNRSNYEVSLLFDGREIIWHRSIKQMYSFVFETWTKLYIYCNKAKIEIS